jgi:hypothetical protein
MALLSSHCCLTMRPADQMLVLEGGRLIEAGAQVELMKAGDGQTTLQIMQAGDTGSAYIARSLLEGGDGDAFAALVLWRSLVGRHQRTGLEVLTDDLAEGAGALPVDDA